MKKILLAGTAIVGVAMLASPAKADLKLDLGGHARFYGVFADNDETSGTTAHDELRSFEFKRDMEVHFQGETTTDSGLTVGVHAELDLGNESANGGVASFLPQAWNTSATFSHDLDPNQLDEAYIYFSGGWGRVNLGSEDGAAYLLQVAAPSADSNVDGMRQYVNGVNSDVWDDQLVDASFGPGAGFNFILGYDNAFFRDSDRLTYLTPKWNGFQAGASWAPKQGQGAVNEAFNGMTTSDDVTDYENLWDIAARWDGEFEGFGISLGVGYTHASNEGGDAGTLPGPTNFGSDDIAAWDAGVTVTWNDFSLGVAVLDYTDTGVNTPGVAGDDYAVWTVGGAWDNGPYHLGATWFTTSNFDADAFGLHLSGAAGDELDIDRYTIGGGYTYGPGMTFRGSVQWGNVDENFGPSGSTDWTQVSLGTDINF